MVKYPLKVICRGMLMNSKEIINNYPFLSSIRNSQQQESSGLTIENAEKAYKKFIEYSYPNQDSEINITLDGKPVYLNTLLGKGGCKLVYDLNNGYAVALLNIQGNGINIAMWERVIEEEIALSQKVCHVGLYTQKYEEATLYFDGYPTKVLKMPTFAQLAAQGQQIIDIKNGDHSGTSLLFENLANLQSPEHWQKLLQGMQEDIILLLSHGLIFDTDTYNLSIVDSSETPAYDRTALGLFSDRKQRVHFCFYDFSNKFETYTEKKHAFLNADGSVERELVEQAVGRLFKKAASHLTAGAMPIEYVNILGGIHTLLLVSEDAEVKEIPDKTIILKKMEDGTHYGYCYDKNGKLQEKKLGKIDFAKSSRVLLSIALDELTERFPSKGEMGRKISINEDENIIERIASIMNCHQYSKMSSALDFHTFAEAAIEEIRPKFIQSATDHIMEKLSQLSLEERQKIFEVHEPVNNGLKF
jgi:hypothetical protein